MKIITRINIVRKNANILKQLILWLWCLSPKTDTDMWFEKYICTVENKEMFKSISYSPFNLDYRFPRSITTTEEGIEYLERYIPMIFNTSKVYLYEKLYNIMKQYIKNYIYSTENIDKVPNKSIINIFNSEKDFKYYSFTNIIIGEENFINWKNEVNNILIDPKSIKMEDIKQINPFVHMNADGNIFMIQNTETNDFLTAVIGCIVWKKLEYNLGYYLTLTNFWSFIKNNEKILEILEMSVEEIMIFAREKLGQETESFKDALYQLEKENIPFELKNKYNYIIHEKDGYIEEKNNKNSDEFLNIWLYSNGGYSAMLDILN